MKNISFIFLLCFLCVISLQSSKAQNTIEEENKNQTMVMDNTINVENLQIVVTTNSIIIDTNFAGSDIFIAGVLENADPLLRRQGHYDVIVVMEGPIKPMIMREKKRKMGLWVNAESLTFLNVPQFYAMATTREIRDISFPETYKKLGLGTEYLPLRATEGDRNKILQYREELLTLKTEQHLYSQSIGAVKFGSSSLFTAKFQLPANVPVGVHQVRAYLFRDGKFITSAATNLEIVKDHIAYEIFNFSRMNSLLYGIIAVFVAIATGFLGRFIFRKD